FNRQPTGPSAAGWDLTGVPWPDGPGTYRSDHDIAHLLVTERWRCGDAAADRLRGIDPARVVGGAVPCPARDDVQPQGTGALALGVPHPSGQGALQGPD